MRTRIKAAAARLTASLLCCALILVSFGAEAWAHVIPRVEAVRAPVGEAFTASAPAMPAPAEISLPSTPLLTAAPPEESSELAAAAAPVPAGADAAPAAEARIGAGPRTASVAARMSRRGAELAGLFGLRRGPEGPPVSPQSYGQATKRMVGRYILAGNGAQAGYEMLLTASMPVYLAQNFHNISLTADLAIVGAFAGVAGRLLSPLLLHSLPLKTSYLALLGAACAAATAIGVLANLDAMDVVPLFALVAAFRLTRDAAVTTERTVIQSIVEKDEAAGENLRGRMEGWAAVTSVLTQNGAAALVVRLGTVAINFLIAPLFYAASIVILSFSLKISKADDDERLAAWRAQAARTDLGRLGRAGAEFKDIFKQIGMGAKLVMRDPVLRASAMISMLTMVFIAATYSVIAPAFGMYAVGTGAGATLAAPIIALIAGFFSLGRLFAGKIVARHAQDVQAAHGNGPAAREAERALTMRSLKYGAWSFLAVGVMALPLSGVGPLVHLGSHASALLLGAGSLLAMWKPKVGLAVAMAPVLLLAFPLHASLAAAAFFGFGVLLFSASLKNDSLFDRRVLEIAPNQYANAASFTAAFSMLGGTLGMTALKFMIYGRLPFRIPSPFPAFAGLPGFWPFVAIFAGLAVPAMLGVLHFTRRLDRLTRPNIGLKAQAAPASEG